MEWRYALCRVCVVCATITQVLAGIDLSHMLGLNSRNDLVDLHNMSWPGQWPAPQVGPIGAPPAINVVNAKQGPFNPPVIPLVPKSPDGKVTQPNGMFHIPHLPVGIVGFPSIAKNQSMFVKWDEATGATMGNLGNTKSGSGAPNWKPGHMDISPWSVGYVKVPPLDDDKGAGVVVPGKVGQTVTGPSLQGKAVRELDRNHHLSIDHLFVALPVLSETMDTGMGVKGVQLKGSEPPVADILIVIDASSNMGHITPSGQVSWNPGVVDFLNRFINLTPMGPDTNKIGVVVVSHGIDDLIPMTHNKAMLLNRLNSLRPSFLGGCTQKGISTASSLFFQYGRPFAVKRIVLLTEGATKCPYRSMEEIAYARKCGIDILHVGFGKEKTIPSEGIQSRWMVPGPDNLAKIVGPVSKRAYIAPIHGRWSPWSEWNLCSSTGTCNIGYTMRFRLCDNPKPMYGGRNCEGFPSEARMCHMTPCIDNSIGHWARWSDFTMCSAACGIGQQTRSRKCVTLSGNPSTTCKGNYVEVIECNVQSCPVDGHWSFWSEWNICSQSCGIGVKVRARLCDNPVPKYGGKSCPGVGLEEKVCDTGIPCPVDGGFGLWTVWTQCSVPCGVGVQTRSRLCDSPLPQFGGMECIGDYLMTQNCDTGIICPIHGGWSPWTAFTICSASCGIGVRSRERYCDNPIPQYGGDTCLGPPVYEEPCDTGVHCPIDGQWSLWSDFKPCSVLCGTGVTQRHRVCNNPAPMYGGQECIGAPIEDKFCDTGIACPIDGGWSPWSDYTPCPVQCGEGIIQRFRECTNPPPQNGGAMCIGMAVHDSLCQTGLVCPINGLWSKWSAWSYCSASCATGLRQRSRLCNNPAPEYGGLSCDGPGIEEEVCDTGVPCKVDGGWSLWVEIGGCSVNCGIGFVKRVRECNNPSPQHGGAICFGPNTETLECDTGMPCSIDGNWSPWSVWGKCMGDCGYGMQMRVRLCNNPAPDYGGLPCAGSSIEEIKCDTGIPCVVHGEWSFWSDWTICSVKCGVGIISRKRTCDNPPPQYGGNDCIGLGYDEQSCDSGINCPIDGVWSAWSPLSKCSVNCGIGIMSRARVCNNPPPMYGGLPCVGPELEESPCDTAIDCPINGNWGPWSEFSLCSAKCGSGMKQRIRECNSPTPMYGGMLCIGEPNEQVPCDSGIFCPVDGQWGLWSDYTRCSVDCGMGVVQRIRECNYPAPMYGGENCIGLPTEEKLCDTGINCPVDGGWSTWSGYGVCSVVCGLGVQQRRRTCTNPPPMFGGGSCLGSPLEEIACDAGPCPVDGGWTLWSTYSPCDASCEFGLQQRVRACTNPVPMYGGAECVGSPVEDRKCDSGIKCSVDGAWISWSAWSVCSVNCGTGLSQRNRECSNPPPMYGGLPCKGPAVDEMVCDTGLNCPIHGSWGAWGQFLPCSVSCGIGIAQRYRVCDNPLPQYGGDMCFGDNTQGKECATGVHCPVNGGFSGWTVWTKCSAKCGIGLQMRTRLCNSPMPMYGGKECIGPMQEKQPCDSGVHCSIDGEWALWSLFSKCSVKCGVGIKERFRTCDNPAPLYGGLPCSGQPVDVQVCDTGVMCPVDGVWSIWAAWGLCSADCGMGFQMRTRTCTDPPPQAGGMPCKGKAVEEQVCNSGMHCPIDGGWSFWSDWKHCSVNCGTGVQSRFRSCDNPPPQYGGMPCVGDEVEETICETGVPCAVHGHWSPWSIFTPCSALCGFGIQKRVRSCNDPAPAFGGDKCFGDMEQIKKCDTGISCPIDGHWALWSPWLACSAACGTGIRVRTRTCTNPAPQYGGQLCSGIDVQESNCDTSIMCGIDGQWSLWSVFGQCSVSCGVGIKTRIRTCTNPPPQYGGKLCYGPEAEDVPCDSGIPCPIDGGWSLWSDYGVCNVACGVGLRGRTRTCTNPPPAYGGLPCQGVDTETIDCDTKISCPVDGGWSLWYEWSYCSAKCGIGNRERRRECNNPLPQNGGLLCKGYDTEFQDCDTGVHCPVHGLWAPWSTYSECTQSCGVGVQVRVRTCTKPSPQYGGLDCIGNFEESIPCDTGVYCPIDGNWGPWSGYGECNVKCGAGMVTRTRLCNVPAPQYGGLDCAGFGIEEAVCDTKVPCSVPGGWSPWSPWGQCSRPCGVGDQIRVRSCTDPIPLYGGLMCKGPDSDMRKCHTGVVCPVHGEWSLWTAWTICDVVCGIGSQYRHRECTPPQYGGLPCDGHAKESRECITGVSCPVDGAWTVWTLWSVCSTTCGLGHRTRQRTCDDPPPMFGGADCVGIANELSDCNTGVICPVDGQWSIWTEWSFCSTSCGTGQQIRNRICDAPQPQYGGLSCTGVSEEVRDCATGKPCPIDGGWDAWTLWTACLGDCGTGVQKRMRGCINPPPLYGGLPCMGAAEELMPCDLAVPCQVDGNWTPWSGYSECSVKCGFGVQTRTRTCTNPPPNYGGLPCVGPDVDTLGCETGVPCSIHGNWGAWIAWTECSVNCGVGELERRRECNNPAPQYGGLPCEGPGIDIFPCDTKVMCPIHGNWGHWTLFSACSASCGIGYKIRYRECDSPAPMYGGNACFGLPEDRAECNAGIACAIDGSWGLWAHWGACSTKCGPGLQSRVRSCDSPPPQNGGMDCFGFGIEERKCKSQIDCRTDGGWTIWTEWGQCTAMCGLGVQARVRECTNPVPLFGGIKCKGPNKEVRDCDAGIPCPVDGEWGAWLKWSYCSVKCGIGIKERRRNCDSPPAQYGGLPCKGPIKEVVECDSGVYCAVDGGWTLWTVWSKCSGQCGMGVQVRMRACENPPPAYGGALCAGFAEDKRDCDTGVQCPVDGEWTPWSDFTPCSAQCGMGIQERFRSCIPPMYGGANCVGLTHETKKCHAAIPCPTDGGWTLWSIWTKCLGNCGMGLQERFRQCTNPKPMHGGLPCSGPGREALDCDTGIPCTVDGNWSPWSIWGKCSAKCGFGSEIRYRTCDNPRPAYGGIPCKGMPEEMRECDSGVACPVDGNWALWSKWSKCEGKCGKGEQVRVRTCSDPKPMYGGRSCEGFPEEFRTCDTGIPCPIDGGWTFWTKWGFCSAKCGTGDQVRTRACTNPLPQFGGKLCFGAEEETRMCDTGIPCVIDGNWSPWSKWDICDAKCGLGEQLRVRTCTNPKPMKGGLYCEGPAMQNRACDSGIPCVVDGNWSLWSPWDICDAKCGFGMQLRIRTCTNPAPVGGGVWCKGDETQSKQCDSGIPCKVDGNWTPWSKWDLCNVKCGTGMHTRVRTCSNPKPMYGGQLCFGQAKESRQCDTGIACGVDGNWSLWSSWDVCDARCGMGKQVRVRTCTNPAPMGDGMWCQGNEMQTRTCDSGIPCSVDGNWTPWSKWDICEAKCGLGKQVRVRTCTNPAPIGNGMWCQGKEMDSRVCDSGIPCSVDGNWSPWSHWDICSAKCDIGTQTRIRTCTDPKPMYGGLLCTGPALDTRHCDTGIPCSIDGNWSPWSRWKECDAKCGKGKQVRVRTCSNPSPIGDGLWCKGDAVESILCDSGIPCSVDGNWALWSRWDYCDAKCGKGMQTRIRTCTDPKPMYGGLLCSGSALETRKCDTGIPCGIDGNWSLWSKWDYCDAKCGKGLQSRIRTCTNPKPMYGGLLCSGSALETRKCDTGIPCGIDGNWSLWSKWDYCDAKCGIGRQTRIRTCTNPKPMYGGLLCSGPALDTRKCDSGIACGIDGNWSQWSKWDYCNVKCGIGSHTRIRTCTNPKPMYGGLLCSGPALETKDCDTGISCSIDGNWSPWSDWNRCDGKCGIGEQIRIRDCTNPPPMKGGLLCTGFPIDKRKCDTGIPCKVRIDGGWSFWSKWTVCDAKCGYGNQLRVRTCTNPRPRHGGRDCKGYHEDQRVCDTGVQCGPKGWSAWGSWSSCSVTCLTGLQIRRRTCLDPGPKGLDCHGWMEDSRVCDTKRACAVDGGWSAWTPWGVCTADCTSGTSIGYKVRKRFCDSPRPQKGGRSCDGYNTEKTECVDFTACSDPAWGSWTKWSQCSTVCGAGETVRVRKCLYPATKTRARGCVGPNKESLRCMHKDCPTRPINCSTECKWDNGIGYAAYPGDCTKFVQCESINGIPLIQNCPWGLLWSQEIMQCVYPKQSECNVCAGVPFGKARAYFISCNSYWKCDGGYGTQHCCPKGQRFNPFTRVCEKDKWGVCDRPCPPVDVVVSTTCHFRESTRGPNYYDEEINGAWIPRPCGYGTVYSHHACQCIHQLTNGTLGPEKHVCIPDLHLTFDSLKADLDRNVGVHIENVTYLGNGMAYFHGKSAINSNIFSNSEWGHDVYTYIRFKPEGTSLKEGLVHNSGCGPSDIGPSVFIGLDRNPNKTVTMKFAAVPEKSGLEYDFVNITTTDNAMIEAWFKFENGRFTAVVNGQEVVLNIKATAIDRRHGALNIGGNLCKIGQETFEGFHGVIDEVRVYRCKPPAWV